MLAGLLLAATSTRAAFTINAPVYTALKAALQLKLGYIYLKDACFPKEQHEPLLTVKINGDYVLKVGDCKSARCVANAICGYYLTKWGLENCCLLIN